MSDGETVKVATAAPQAKLSVLHRNALHGLLARDREVVREFQRGQQEMQAEWYEVLAELEIALRLSPGAIGSTHTLDLSTMTVNPVFPPPDGGVTPAEQEPDA